jgi:hypothetical protein
MDLTGLISSVLFSVRNIDMGRKGVASDGNEHEGRILYEKGISIASAVFLEAHASGDPETIILVEYAFLEQELQFCDDADTYTKSSLTQAIQSFDDALRCLKTVEDAAGYRCVETSYPTHQRYRIQGLPKDAVHIACGAHHTRLCNVLRSPGINMREKSVLQQRAANMIAAQTSYIEKQKAALN